ncbi:MAG TPA: VOC family protein, partial [Phototrophicaceae bacterium]|nr:VOC family protein [Phototrophicaceae bacterium]
QTSFLRLVQEGEGFGGYALQSDALEAEVGRIQARGLSVELRPAGGRVRPDGQQLQWRTAALENTMTPFFIQDITPRQFRVPADSQTNTHPNGVTGVSEIVINAANLDDTIGRYQMLTGLQNLISFPVGETQIRLTTTAAMDTKNDETLYQMTLHTTGQVQRKSLPDGGLIHFSNQE